MASPMILSRHPDVETSEWSKVGYVGLPDEPKFIGYWHRDPKYGSISMPHPGHFIVPDWDPEQKEKVAQYLRNGKTLISWRGPSSCRLCFTHVDGYRCFTDGEWVWPEGLVHYIEEHNVRPPQDFIDKAIRG